MDNIILDVRMGAHFMGDEFALSRAEPIHVVARAPRPVAGVSIIKDGKVIYTSTPGRRDVDFQFRDTGDVMGRHSYYVRV